VIPDLKINSTIIDGQHRVNGFKLLSEELQKGYDLLCSVYIDLPNPYQAFIFATVNMNQRKVDKSLAYELYGYNLNEEESNFWTPEKLGVFLTRKINFDKESCFYQHILVAAENDEILFDVAPKKSKWHVSTATIVNGILSLITANNVRDRDKLHQYKVEKRNRKLLEPDTTPLRNYFIEGNDLLIYKIIYNFFNASHLILYKEGSYIFKTVGIQAQFRFLKTLLKENLQTDKNISQEYFSNFLSKFKHINFKDNFFTASGIGASRIANVMLISSGFKNIEDINKDEDKEEYKRLLN